MKGVDYNKALATDRNNFNETIRKTQDSAEKRVSDSNERADGVMKKQRDTFVEDKADLESTYEKNLDKLNDKTRTVAGDNAARINAEKVKEREAFTQDSLTKKKDFEQRLSDITSSYKKVFASEKEANSDVQNFNKDKYQKGIASTKNELHSKLEGFRDDMQKSEHRSKDANNRERQNLVRTQDLRMQDAAKNAGKKTVDLRDRIQTDIRKSQAFQAAEAEENRKYTGDQISQTQKSYENKFQKMDTDYGEKSEKLVKSRQEETQRGDKENQIKVTGARQDFEKQLRRMELDLRRKDPSSGEYAKVMNRQQGNMDEELVEARVDGVKAELAQARQVFAEKSAKDQNAFNEDLKREKFEGSSLMDRKVGEAKADKIVTVSKDRDKNEVQIANRENQNRLEKSAYEKQLMLERNNASDRMNKLKENFNLSMKKLEEKHSSSIQDVTIVSNTDKGEFTKKMQAARVEEIFELKREFSKLMDHTVQDYENRLATYQRDNEYLKQTMDNKVQTLTDLTSKQLDSQRTMFEDRRSADVKTAKILVDQKEHSLKTTMNQMSAGFQKKIDKLTIENDTKLKLLTNDYENKLKELRATTSKELASSEANRQIEVDRLKMTYQDEKTRTVQAFENQIASIKTGHRDQMDQMKDFKRLS